MAERWHRRAGHLLRHSLKARLVALFLVLALATSAVFLAGMQQALGIGWRDAARPLLYDYVDRLVVDLGTPPDAAKARALTERLPVTIRIAGPATQWESHPRRHGARDLRDERDAGLLVRRTADGHRVEFGLNLQAWRDKPRLWGWGTLAVLLLVTALAYAYARRLLRPLDDIRAGAQRFGRGEFAQAIPVRRRDELGELAGDVNAMAASIRDMLEAQRALLLAMSHELRSPLTRARLNAELLPEDGDVAPRREALMRDLQAMGHLVTDLLESERLGQGHAALHREPTDLAALVREAALAHGANAQAVETLPEIAVDRMRMRLLLRNLVDNATRHGAGAGPAELRLAADGAGGAVLTVRDRGPGVAPDALPQLAQPFYRPDASRGRATGGVGLGLYLCRLIAQAHGGTLTLRNADPGLEVEIHLPGGSA
ncbi:sensor histidine kinase [Ramlibacter sp.]|uniref:sensor histidine kinase n=1 Tax=Ramlibacter sp. TaxID=1917967 RepID=UPI003D1168F4